MKRHSVRGQRRRAFVTAHGGLAGDGPVEPDAWTPTVLVLADGSEVAALLPPEYLDAEQVARMAPQEMRRHGLLPAQSMLVRIVGDEDGVEILPVLAKAP